MAVLSLFNLIAYSYNLVGNKTTNNLWAKYYSIGSIGTIEDKLLSFWYCLVINSVKKEYFK